MLEDVPIRTFGTLAAYGLETMISCCYRFRPDLSAYDEDELYPVPGLCMQSGEQARLFSSRHPKTVRRFANSVP
jgi:hypothetical protein